jgi:hypothetical protein
MQQQGDLTGEVPEALGRADQAMREAQEALGNGTDARPHQQEAMRRLQEGGRQMAQQMQRQFGQGQGEGEGEGDEDGPGDMEMGGEGPDGQQQLGEGRDPLGRRGRENTGNADNGSDTRVPDEAELLRTRRLQEELRRRGAERERPPEELEYIDRLSAPVLKRESSARGFVAPPPWPKGLCRNEQRAALRRLGLREAGCRRRLSRHPSATGASGKAERFRNIMIASCTRLNAIPTHQAAA